MSNEAILKVLLVDDEPILLQGLSQLVDWHGLGYRLVGQAENGQDALELAEQLQPDLVISDMRMPMLDGVGFIAALHETMPETAILVLSAYEDFSYAQAALENGVSGYLLKPVNEAKLAQKLTVLKQQLARRRYTSRLESRLADNLAWLQTQFWEQLKAGQFAATPPDELCQQARTLKIEVLEADAWLVFHFEFKTGNVPAWAEIQQWLALSRLNARQAVPIYSRRRVTVIVPVGNEGESGAALALKMELHANRPDEMSVRGYGALRTVDEIGKALAQPPGNSEANRTNATVAEICRYMLEHFAEDLGLPEIARRFHLNPTYLSQLFKRETGETFSDHLTRLRLDKAELLLLSTTLKIEAVAKAVGYDDPKYFSQVFQRRAGVTPSQFRLRTYRTESKT
jgi:two-component system, response regulator YesN